MWKVGDILDLLVGSYSDVLMDVHVFVYYYNMWKVGDVHVWPYCIRILLLHLHVAFKLDRSMATILVDLLLARIAR